MRKTNCSKNTYSPRTKLSGVLACDKISHKESNRDESGARDTQEVLLPAELQTSEENCTNACEQKLQHEYDKLVAEVE